MRVLTLLCALLPVVARAFMPVGGRHPTPALSANPLNTLFSVLKEGKGKYLLRSVLIAKLKYLRRILFDDALALFYFAYDMKY